MEKKEGEDARVVSNCIINLSHKTSFNAFQSVANSLKSRTRERFLFLSNTVGGEYPYIDTSSKENVFFKYLLRKQSETNFGQEEIEDGQKKKVGGNSITKSQKIKW